MDHAAVRELAKEFEMWTARLDDQVKDVVPEVINGHQDAGLDRIAERIVDVMSSYDALLVSLQQEPHFECCLARLNQPET